MSDLEFALAAQDEALFATLFLEDSHWRDLVALTWDTCQFWGRDAVRVNLFARGSTARPRNFHLDPDRSTPSVLIEKGTAEFFTAFETEVGTASAFVTLRLDPSSRWGMRARLLATSLTGLHSSSRPASQSRRGYEPATPGETWLECRRRAHSRAVDPDVLIVGGGQSGATMAARLESLGVSYAVVNKEARPGESWRRRYSSLALHTPTYANNLPHVKLPQTYPDYMSKDQWGGWIDAYVDFMDLNYWSCTEFVHGWFDEDARVWTVEVRGETGSSRTVRPKHIVLAVGFTGTEPLIPDVPGLADFGGAVVHSSQFTHGADYTGKNVIVLGTATSAHDIALELRHNGATVAMGQRGPACVVPITEADYYNADYLNPAWSEEEVDQRRNSGAVKPLILEKLIAETERTERQFADMFDGLRKAGMTLTIGAEKAGWLWRLQQTFSGYYLDVGCSQVIIDGGIKVIQMSDVERFTPRGLQLTDGTVVELDAVVCATGYRNVRDTVERLFGVDVADRVGRIGGMGEDGEHRNLCRPTGQAHLWAVFGGIMDARKMSPLLALQILAQLSGVVPSLVRAPDGSLRELEPAQSGVAS
jgi:putative flavoprotein involved in K+ transport